MAGSTLSVKKVIDFFDRHIFQSYEELFLSVVHDTQSYIDVCAVYREKVIKRIIQEKNLSSYCILVVISQNVFHEVFKEVIAKL